MVPKGLEFYLKSLRDFGLIVVQLRDLYVYLNYVRRETRTVYRMGRYTLCQSTYQTLVLALRSR